MVPSSWCPFTGILRGQEERGAATFSGNQLRYGGLLLKPKPKIFCFSILQREITSATERIDFVLLNMDYFHGPMKKLSEHFHLYKTLRKSHNCSQNPACTFMPTPSWILFPLPSLLLHLVKSGSLSTYHIFWKVRDVLCFPKLCTEWMASILGKACSQSARGEDRSGTGWDPGRGASHVTNIISDHLF